MSTATSLSSLQVALVRLVLPVRRVRPVHSEGRLARPALQVLLALRAQQGLLGQPVRPDRLALKALQELRARQGLLVQLDHRDPRE